MECVVCGGVEVAEEKEVILHFVLESGSVCYFYFGPDCFVDPLYLSEIYDPCQNCAQRTGP